MSATVFVDTNVLVYFRDNSETEKQHKAAAWLSYLWQERLGRLSTQVLNEYYVTVTQKLSPGLSREEARADIRNLMVWEPVPIDEKIIENAWFLQDRFRFSWWDSLIVAAARRADCEYLLSEDLQHGQKLDGLKIIDPFAVRPEEIG